MSSTAEDQAQAAAAATGGSGAADGDAALFQSGVELFGLKQFDKAKEVFETLVKKDENNKSWRMWLRKTNAELSGAVAQPVTAAAATPTPAPAETQPPAAAAAVAAAPAAKPTVRREWYQTDTHVFVSIFIRNVRKEDVKIDIGEQTLSVTVKLPHGSEYSLELDMAFPLQPAESSYEVLSTKMEIKLKKAEVGLRWPALESAPQNMPLPVMASSAAVAAAKPAYPSSSRKQHNWDSLEVAVKQEEEEEKPEGDAALQKLFKQIYSNATDEQRRAMNKSYTESGGTTLSTNWDEVAVKPVPIQPPTGMEARKFDL